MAHREICEFAFFVIETNKRAPDPDGGRVFPRNRFIAWIRRMYLLGNLKKSASVPCGSTDLSNGASRSLAEASEARALQ
jgi:hypothetical protein